MKHQIRKEEEGSLLDVFRVLHQQSELRDFGLSVQCGSVPDIAHASTCLLSRQFEMLNLGMVSGENRACTLAASAELTHLPCGGGVTIRVHQPPPGKTPDVVDSGYALLPFPLMDASPSTTFIIRSSAPAGDGATGTVGAGVVAGIVLVDIAVPFARENTIAFIQRCASEEFAGVHDEDKLAPAGIHLSILASAAFGICRSSAHGEFSHDTAERLMLRSRDDAGSNVRIPARLTVGDELRFGMELQRAAKCVNVSFNVRLQTKSAGTAGSSTTTIELPISKLKTKLPMRGGGGLAGLVAYAVVAGDGHDALCVEARMPAAL